MFKYFSLINTKALLPLWIGLTFVIVFDIAVRLTAIPSYETSVWKSNNSVVNKSLYFSQDQANAIISDINNYEKDALTASNKDKNTSKIDEANQQGDLNQLYAGDFRYRVIGIFKEKSFFAVIQQHNLKTKERELIQVGISENINNYQVSNIFANKVLLKSNDNRNISLFLYQTNAIKTINSK